MIVLIKRKKNENFMFALQMKCSKALVLANREIQPRHLFVSFKY